MNNVEMHEIALVSGTLVELLRRSLNDWRVATPTTRQRVAQSLLAASIDHAVSLNLLLSRPSPSAAFSAVGLFRLQLDTIARGIFFARPEYTSDEEVTDFMLNDRMPLVKPTNQRKRQIRLDELIARLRDFISEVSPELALDGLHLRFSYALDSFNGFVHGGRDVVEAYQEHPKFGLIFQPNFKALSNISIHATTLCMLAELTQLFFVVGQKSASFANEVERISAFQAFFEATIRFKSF